MDNTFIFYNSDHGKISNIAIISYLVHLIKRKTPLARYTLRLYTFFHSLQTSDTFFFQYIYILSHSYFFLGRYFICNMLDMHVVLFFFVSFFVN